MINRFPDASQKSKALDTLVVMESGWCLEMLNRRCTLEVKNQSIRISCQVVRVDLISISTLTHDH
jgi:hypothetical protein